MLIDCHTHLDSFSDSEIAQILDRGKKVGVRLVITAGTTIRSSQRSAELSNRFPGLFSGIGLHPMNLVEPVHPSTYDNLYDLATSEENVVVISEIGLDFMEGTPDRATQYQAFREQIRLARELNLPIIFHSRESHNEVFRLLREEKAYEIGGAMHYFQGNVYEAMTAISLGFKISLARPLLRLTNLQKVVTTLPLTDIVLETDSAPQPFKSKRENWTEPRHVRSVAKKVAELQGKTIEEIETTTTHNVQRLLHRKWPLISRSLDGPIINNTPDNRKQHRPGN